MQPVMGRVPTGGTEISRLRSDRTRNGSLSQVETRRNGVTGAGAKCGLIMNHRRAPMPNVVGLPRRVTDE